jgi:uncharacterized protein (DUF427 family)
MTIAPNPNVVRVSFAGHMLALSIRALDVTDDGGATVIYIPSADVDMALLRPSDHSTYCPRLGTATFYHVHSGGRTASNVAWTYATPFGDVAAIAGHIAFDHAHVDAISQTPREVHGGSLA